MSPNFYGFSMTIENAVCNPWNLVALAASAKLVGDDSLYGECRDLYKQILLREIESDVEYYSHLLDQIRKA